MKTDALKMEPRTPGIGRFLTHRSYVLKSIVLAITLFATNCASTDAVSKFASQSSQALVQGEPVLKDIYGSCERGYMATRDVGNSLVKKNGTPTGAFTAAKDEQAGIAGACSEIQSDQAPLLALSAVLNDYFTAINQLASAGGTTDKAKQNSDNASQQSQSAKQGAKPAANQTLVTGINAAGQLAGVLAKLFLSGYQNKKLATALIDADQPLSDLVDALIQIVNTNYLGTPQHEGVLDHEREQLAIQNSTEINYWAKHEGVSDLVPSIEIVLRAQWDRHTNEIDSKTTAAQAYVQALMAMKEGHGKLAAQAKGGKLNGKAIIAALQPAEQSLNTNIPKLLKF